MATPLFTATPALTGSYNPSIADTFSWVPMDGAGRTLFARAVYDISNVSGNGFDFIVPSAINAGLYSSIQVVSACRIKGLTATGVSTTTVQNLTAYDLPVNFTFSAVIQGISLQSGTVIAYK